MNKFLSLCALILFITCVVHGQNVKKNMEKPEGKNIVCFIPFSAFTSGNIGIGLSYERNKNEYVGIKVPILAAINQPGFSSGVELKLYPVKNTGVAKYAVAPMIMFGYSEEKGDNDIFMPPNTWYTPTYQHTRFGFLLNQSINITILREIYIGLEGGIGLNYIDQKKLLPGKTKEGNDVSFLSQFHISTGYRF